MTGMIETSAASHLILKVSLNFTSKPTLKPVISNLKNFQRLQKKVKKFKILEIM
jgi:hypothetical protein